MNTADTRLTLDGYRIQVLEKLKGCPDPATARDLLVEVDGMLRATGLSARAQQAFWQGLSTDLEIVAEEASRLLGKGTAATFAAVVAASQADIARRLGPLSS